MVGYALNAIGCAAIIYSALGLNVSRVSGGFLYLGKISYGLNVFLPLGLLTANVLLLETFIPGLGGVSRAVIGLVFTVAFAITSYKFLELPFLKMKSRFTWIPSRPI